MRVTSWKVLAISLPTPKMLTHKLLRHTREGEKDLETKQKHQQQP